jgi:hypothetical protein
MVASGQPATHARAIAADAVRRRWPSAAAETVARVIRASAIIDQAKGVLLAQGERPSWLALVLSGTFVGT